MISFWLFPFVRDINTDAWNKLFNMLIFQHDIFILLKSISYMIRH